MFLTLAERLVISLTLMDNGSIKPADRKAYIATMSGIDDLSLSRMIGSNGQIQVNLDDLQKESLCRLDLATTRWILEQLERMPAIITRRGSWYVSSLDTLIEKLERALEGETQMTEINQRQQSEGNE